MSKTFVLSDRTQIQQSDRKSNRSGYTGAAFSPSWTLDHHKPFVAACANPRDPLIMSQLRAQHRTAWHGGYYADAREAAYVVAKFHEDPVGTENTLYAHDGSWPHFPSDLYNLPVICTAAQAQHQIKSVRASKPKNTVASKSALDLQDVMAAVGVALKGVPKNNKLIRETLQAQMPWFRNVQDAISLAWDLVSYASQTKNS